MNMLTGIRTPTSVRGCLADDERAELDDRRRERVAGGDLGDDRLWARLFGGHRTSHNVAQPWLGARRSSGGSLVRPVLHSLA